MRVKFADLCDTCDKRSEEYDAWPDCLECLNDFCPACGVVTVEPDVDQRARGYCNNCIRTMAADTLKIQEALSKIDAAQLRRVLGEVV